MCKPPVNTTKLVPGSISHGLLDLFLNRDDRVTEIHLYERIEPQILESGPVHFYFQPEPAVRRVDEDVLEIVDSSSWPLMSGEYFDQD